MIYQLSLLKLLIQIKIIEQQVFVTGKTPTGYYFKLFLFILKKFQCTKVTNNTRTFQKHEN